MLQAPRIFPHNDNLFGIDLTIFKGITEKHNALIALSVYIEWDDPERNEKFAKLLQNRQVDLTLNTVFHGVENTIYRLFINTYDDNGYCALVPIPTRLSFLHFLLSIYDWLSWFSMITLTIVAAIVWKVAKRRSDNSNTASYFMFGVIANFVGQSIPFRGNRFLQTSLLQLCIMMTFILGNAYQSLIIASMAASREGVRMKTSDEMFKSNLKFKVDPRFYRVMKESGDFDEVVERMEHLSNSIDYKLTAQQNYALIVRCDTFEILMNSIKEFKVAEYFYPLPERMQPFYEQFLLAHRSPFYDMLQKNHNYIFEAGIRQYWKEHFKDGSPASVEREQNYWKNEKYLLIMDDVYGIFYILLSGLTASLIVFLFEVIKHFYFDTISAHFRRALNHCKLGRRLFGQNRVQPFTE